MPKFGQHCESCLNVTIEYNSLEIATRKLCIIYVENFHNFTQWDDLRT